MAEMRDFIESYMQNKNLSLTKLAALLGYKSKTSIARIMDAESSAEITLKFALAMEREFDLSRAERETLREAAQITILGYQAYRAEQEMWRYLRGDGAYPSPVSAPLIEDAATGAKMKLDERYAKASNLRVTLLNCSGVPLFGALKTFLLGGASVTHYVHVDFDTVKTIRMINAIMPVLYEKGYMCYLLDEAERAISPVAGMAGADMMLCQYTNATNEACEDVVIFNDAHSGRLLCRALSEGALARWLGIPFERYQPFKNDFVESAGFGDYEQFVMDCAALEANRSIWKVKPDIGFEYIPSDIIEAAMWEGPMRDVDQFPRFLDTLRPVCAKRHENMISRKKPMFMVLKRNAMTHFALTGKTSDHFWGMRPLTPEERIRILSILIKQQKCNPFFHMFFLKDDDLIRDEEIICFENLGVLVVKQQTDYDLANGHAEVMITHREFMRLYLYFFKNTLIKDYVSSAEETMTFMEQLLRLCRQR